MNGPSLRRSRDACLLAGALLAACNGPLADREEGLRIAGYTTIGPAGAPQLYRNTANGYQLTMPAGVVMRQHRNGSFVIAEDQGTLFGIWLHAESTAEQVQEKLLEEFGRWCGDHPDAVAERAAHGGVLRLVPVEKGPFRGYKAIPRDLPDAAPARFYAFKSPRQDGYFGFDLPRAMATAVLASLEPLP